MARLLDYELWSAVLAGMHGIIVVPLFFVWILTLALARRRKDPARVGFTWLKVVHPAFGVALVLLVVAGIVHATSHDGGYIVMYFSLAAQLFEDIANIILVSTLSALGDGFMFAATGRHTLSSTAFRYGTYVACLGLLSLAIACFATSLTDRSVNQWALTIYNIEFPYAWYISDIVEVVASKTELEHARTTQMAAVFNILYWVASILQLGQASVVMHKAMKTESLRKCARIFLVSNILAFVRATTFLIYYAIWVLAKRNGGDIRVHLRSGNDPTEWIVVDAVLNTWAFFTILSLLLAIGMRKQKGLWTTRQHEAVPGTGNHSIAQQAQCHHQSQDGLHVSNLNTPFRLQQPPQ